jgi:hypothetical protein
MGNELRRILILLASARVSIRDLDGFMRFARDNPHDILEHYRDVVRQIETPGRNTISQSYPLESDLNLFESILRDISYLIQNSKIHRGLAARQIAKELVSMGEVPNERAIQFTPKDGFESWLKKIFDRVGSSALLRATTIVVDRYTKRPRSDWPLTSS